MKEHIEVLSWISEWFNAECNGDWEYENQIIIKTVSNPGWHVKIDLQDTSIEDVIVEESADQNKDDWFFFIIKDKSLNAAGDLTKLSFILNRFREVVLVNKNSF